MDVAPIALELGVLGLTVFALLLDLFAPPGEARGRWNAGIVVGGLAALLAASFFVPAGGTFTRAFVLDPFALYMKRVLLAAGLLTVFTVPSYAARRGWGKRVGDCVVLLLFALLGGMALVSARELLTLFVSFELLSMPLYALVAIDKARAEAPEGALKIYLFGSVSSAALALGIGVLFAATGTTFWAEAVAAGPSRLADLGLLLLLVGFGFKVAMFPFSLWVPDTYQAAPTPVVAFLSVAPKAAGIAALFRLWLEGLSDWSPGMTSWLLVPAAATMIVGNLLALPQTDLKRLLAYSGIAHIGYVLLALAAGSEFGAGMALFYFVAYLFSNVGAFLGVAAVEAAGEPATLDGVRNLVRRSPVMAGAWLAFLLSLGGIPFVLGFWGKLYVFLAAGRAGLWSLVLLGALLSVVALFYYLTVARSMFIAPADASTAPIVVPRAIAIAVLACAVVVAVGGLVPQVFVEPALAAVKGM